MLKIRILGVPLDLGQERRGVDMGPSAVRAAGLNSSLRSLGHKVEDAGDIHVKIAEMQPFGDKRAKYLNEIAETCQEVAQAVGCIWLDAHADMNTPETSPSGNVHGMPFAATLGLGPEPLSKIFGFAPKIRPEHCVLIGARDLDSRERRQVRESGVNVFTMRAIDEQGMRAVVEKSLALASKDTAGFVVSFDMDVMDPDEAPGVGTPVRGGITFREAHLAMEMVADSKRMLAMELVEINPIIDILNKTAILGVGLVSSALGKKIL
ncbi:MAG: arginase [Acidobacteria bacterium]|nr:arginase [Acidobacteriota bacterium]